MSRKNNGSTSLATVETATPTRQMTCAQANELFKARALELYHEARTHREEQILAFESEYGRVDRIDHTILADLQRIQARLAPSRRVNRYERDIERTQSFKARRDPWPARRINQRLSRNRARA